MSENKCPSCDKEYKYKRGLSSHFDDYPSHTPDSWIDCPSCDKSFETEQSMKSHHSQRHNESLVEKIQDCTVCGESVSRSRDYEKTFCSPSCRDEWQSENYVGENNPAYKDAKITLTCEWCGEEFNVWEKRKDRRRFCSIDCAGSWKSNNWVGEESPVYTGYNEDYGDGWYKMRRIIREKYEGECQLCGIVSKDRKHDVHHIIPVGEFDDPSDAHYEENLTLLCRSCHQKAEYGISIDEQKSRLK